MKRISFFLVLSLMYLVVQANDTLTLRECYRTAVANHPLQKQTELLELKSQLEIQNIQSNWYPNLQLTGRATYQSDIPEIGDIEIQPKQQKSFQDLAQSPTQPSLEDFEISGMPSPPNDQYKMQMEVNQTIYEGGSISQSKELEKAQLNANKKEVQVEIRKRKQHINDVYFALLFLDQRKKLLQLTKNVLVERKNDVKTGITHGSLMASDSMVLRSEILQIEQQIEEIHQQKQSSMEVLEELTGKKISKQAYITTPEINFDTSDAFSRPEHELYDIQKEILGELDIKLLK